MCMLILASAALIALSGTWAPIHDGLAEFEGHRTHFDPPAVLSDRVGKDGRSSSAPASRIDALHELAGEQATISQPGTN